MKVDVEDILGYSIFSSGLNACLDSIEHWIANGSSCRWLACINPHSYAVSRRDLSFSTALSESNWLIPDGVGILLASRIMRGKIHERVTGSDIFFGINERLNNCGGSVFFLGASEETLHEIKKKMSLDYPNICVAGAYSPPFKNVFSQIDIDEMVSKVNKARPDVLWVGMTSPKQDLWIYENRNILDVRFAAGIGAVFDFYIGRINRSSLLFQRLGLEWLPRLLREPSRLWRRMFVSAPIFLWDVVMQRLSNSR